jgi:3-oxoacyl-[acyl-carrier-protein] synthase I
MMNLAITGIGMLTPVGLCTSEVFHSVRCNISRLAVQALRDRAGELIVGGKIATRIPFTRERRLEALAALAFGQAWQQASGSGERNRLYPTSLLMGGPEPIRPGFRFPSNDFDLLKWFKGLGVNSVGPCQTVNGGACSAQVALQLAAEILESKAARSCAVGAADTQLHIHISRWHEDHFRLKCAYLTDGLMPSEAACFLIVETESNAIARGAKILARIASAEIQLEEATVLSDKPNTAKGLTTAVRAVLDEAKVAATQIGFVWSDLNGESYRAREWAFSETRLGFQTQTELIHPADCQGDLGTASGVVLLGLAAQAQVTGWGGRKPALVFTGSEGGIRAATIVVPPQSLPSGAVRQVTEKLPRVLAADIELARLGLDDASFEEAEDPLRAYFEWQLRQEHLDSLAGLYFQRKSLLQDRTIPWIRLREPEQRMLNHLDAAVASGTNSAWAVASGVRSDDEGFCFAGALVLAALANPRNFAQLDAVLAEPVATNLVGIEAGLKQAPESQILQSSINAWMGHPKPDVQAMAASVAGYRGGADAGILMELLHSSNSVLIAAAAEALGRMRHGYALLRLEQLLSHQESFVQEAAIRAALLLGSQTAETHCRRLCELRQIDRGRPAFYLALCGRLNDVNLFIPSGTANGDPRMIEAAGILGNVMAVPRLLRMLAVEDGEIKKSAATALDLITGAGLREKVKVTEKVDLLGGEFAETEREVEMLTTSPRAWEAWWYGHRAHFRPDRQWRRGRPFDVGQCLAELSDPHSGFQDRQRAGWELAMRGRPNIRFEPDWFVARQQESLEAWKKWWADNNRTG